MRLLRHCVARNDIENIMHYFKKKIKKKSKKSKKSNKSKINQKIKDSVCKRIKDK